MKKLLALIIASITVLSTFMARPRVSTNTMTFYYNDRVDGAVYVDVTLYLGRTIKIKGWFNEERINTTLREIIRGIGGDPVEAVRKLAVEFSRGNNYIRLNTSFMYRCINGSCRIACIRYSLEPWRLFTFKGGWCLYAALRANYLLDLAGINVSRVLIVMENPYHAVLLIDKPVGKPVALNNNTYYVYINYPERPVPDKLGYENTVAIRPLS